MNDVFGEEKHVDVVNDIVNGGDKGSMRTIYEEKWTDENEKLMKYWLKQCTTSSVAHNKKGRSFKFKYEIFGLPSSIVPLMYSPFAGLYSGNEGIEVANVVVLVFTGLLSGVNTFFNFGEKKQQHFEYEAKYSDVATTILVELAKERDFRIRADRFIEMIQAKIDNYSANAPLL
jgi:hypothetical protein